MTTNEPRRAACVIAGCGPAGAMLGWMLARAGVPVVVLEKHGDFLRDFRGDTVHPSTIQLMDDLGVVDDFLARPHQRQDKVLAVTDNGEMELAAFKPLKLKYPFIAYMPQWDFLDFVIGQAQQHPEFSIEMNAEVAGLIEENGKVVGVRYRQDGREHEVRATLTVAADGRNSLLRELAGLPVEALAAPMDLLWFSLSRKDTDPDMSFARISRGHLVALIHRGDYWQTAYLIPKGTWSQLRDAPDGLDTFHDSLEQLVPWLEGRASEVQSWSEVHELDVRLDRATRWYKPGFLAIGDAAHAMSVVGGVGINLAVQDAIATARIMIPKLRKGKADERSLAKVQRRRRLPTALTQKLQKTIQDNFLQPLLAGETGGEPPALLRAIFRFGPFQRAKARIIAVGFRPERATKLPTGK